MVDSGGIELFDNGRQPTVQRKLLESGHRIPVGIYAEPSQRAPITNSDGINPGETYFARFHRGYRPVMAGADGLMHPIDSGE